MPKVTRRSARSTALNFDLLVDENAGVATAYGAIKPGGEGIQRSVVIVGKDGKVIFAEHGAPPWQRILSVMRKTDDMPVANCRSRRKINVRTNRAAPLGQPSCSWRVSASSAICSWCS